MSVVDGDKTYNLSLKRAKTEERWGGAAPINQISAKVIY